MAMKDVDKMFSAVLLEGTRRLSSLPTSAQQSRTRVRAGISQQKLPKQHVLAGFAVDHHSAITSCIRHLAKLLVQGGPQKLSYGTSAAPARIHRFSSSSGSIRTLTSSKWC